MLTHMSTLGFPVTTEKDFRHYVYQTTEFGEKIETKHGSYTYWSLGNGVELWVQTNHHKRIIGMNPHFSGSARMWAAITARVPRYRQTILDGAFYAWAEPYTDDPESGDFPFVFDLPDYDVHDDLSLPTTTSVQIAAFANELRGFENEEDYKKNAKGRMKIASEFFIPSGLFTSEGKTREQAEAQVMFSGYVRDTEMITNPITGQKFYWARVRVLSGEVDVVADPQVVQGKIVSKGIVRGTFWLSGRLV